MKHESIVIPVEELISEMFDSFDEEEILELLDIDSLLVHDLYHRVTWPEHVKFPKFNSDASYQNLGKYEDLDFEDVDKMVKYATNHSTSLWISHVLEKGLA